MSSTINIVEQSYLFHARPETVFRFFTDPARFARWWNAPGGGDATIDPRPGGEIVIRYRQGTVMRGRVQTIVPHDRFAFSWGYEGSPVGPGSTDVEITLRPTTDATEVTLRHSGLPAGEQSTGHDAGWRHYMSVLAGLCAREEHAATLPQTVAAYAAAWNAPSHADTARFLEQCADPHIEFRDAFACIRGRDALAAHIANAKRHVPGHRLDVTGPATLCHGFVRVPWTAAHAGGELARGHNFCRLGMDGKLTQIIGFWDAIPGG